MRRLLPAAAALTALAGCGGGDAVDVPTAAPTVAQVTTESHGGAEGTTAPSASTTPAPAAPRTVPRPRIVQWRIPFGLQRKREMATYSKRHYGDYEWRLKDPQLIVEHWTQTPSAGSTRDVFLPDTPDPELHERPGTCSHFVIARSGTIYQLVDLGIRCRHAFGVNWTAIGIEHVGYSDTQVMGDRRQVAASLALTRWLRCRYAIPVRNVIGHAETAKSPYWRELRRKGRDTHDDMGPKAMRTYRRQLAARSC